MGVVVVFCWEASAHCGIVPVGVVVAAFCFRVLCVFFVAVVEVFFCRLVVAVSLLFASNKEV